ncbi:MAG: hypothetical protein AAF192_18120 [Pseudomonadota bacterium]
MTDTIPTRALKPFNVDGRRINPGDDFDAPKWWVPRGVARGVVETLPAAADASPAPTSDDPPEDPALAGRSAGPLPPTETRGG